jgi:hypothetical protein
MLSIMPLPLTLEFLPFFCSCIVLFLLFFFVTASLCYLLLLLLLFRKLAERKMEEDTRTMADTRPVVLM